MIPETLRARVRRLFESLRPGAVELLDECRALYSPDVRFEDPMQVTTDVEAFIATTARLINRARVLSFSVHAVVGTDDEFFFTWTMRFAFKVGPVAQVDGASHFRARDGRVVMHRDYWDLANLLATTVPGGQQVLRAMVRPLT